MTDSIIHTLPLGTIVAYCDATGEPDSERFVVAERTPGDVTQDGGVRHFGESALIFVNDADDGTPTYFTAQEFADLEAVVVSSPDPAVASVVSGGNWNEALIALAIQFDRTLTFRYIKGNGDIADRRVQPEAVHESRNGARTVVGYDPDRADVRAFRLDRIKGDVTA